MSDEKCEEILEGGGGLVKNVVRLDLGGVYILFLFGLLLILPMTFTKQSAKNP